MAYEKTVWENNTTPLNADNMNHIENGIEANSLKLDTVEEGAQVNVQANWNETDAESDAYIQNKPSVCSFYKHVLSWKDTKKDALVILTLVNTHPDAYTYNELKSPGSDSPLAFFDSNLSAHLTIQKDGSTIVLVYGTMYKGSGYNIIYATSNNQALLMVDTVETDSTNYIDTVTIFQ